MPEASFYVDFDEQPQFGQQGIFVVEGSLAFEALNRCRIIGTKYDEDRRLIFIVEFDEEPNQGHDA